MLIIRTMRRVAGALVTAASLGACADASYFYKEGATQQDYKKAAYLCERDTRGVASSFGTSVIAAPIYAREFAIRCMEADGWQMRKAGTPPPAHTEPPASGDGWGAKR